jgi:pimeloyl-ACP methyl ester carboxylesterase
MKVLHAMAEHVREISESARFSWYDSAGHTAFLECPTRFNRELAALTRQVNAP